MEHTDSDSSDDESTIISLNSDTETDSDSAQEDKESNLASDLSHFVAVSKTRQIHTNLLLKILHKNNITNIPKCHQTLMQTPKEKISQKPAESGSYFHYKTLEECILLYEPWLQNRQEIEIDIAIDGFKPFHATSLDVWPIMCGLSSSVETPPLLVGCYAGKRAPKDPDILLVDLLADIERLTNNGVHFPSSGKTLPARVRLFIMDAPARAMICGIKNHSSYEGCPLCVMDEKIYGDAVVYTASIGTITRDDQTFAARIHPDHHLSRYLENPSCLELAGFRMISQFPIEPMHAIELGT